MRFKILSALAAVAALQAVPASAAVITNGSFENGTLSNPFSTVGTGGTNITGWSVTSGTVDYIGNLWQHQDGTRSVDLAGNSIGALAQTFATVIGETYSVAFYIARNPDGGLLPRTGTVQATGSAAQALFYNNGASTRSNMGWLLNLYQFTATSNSTTLTFSADATSQGLYGLALDNVSISSVPESATWCMMLAGFGLMGFALRRRKTSARLNLA